ncbi:hypothetical protein GcM3_192054 [Golovinomyces cichoracearum]|uniref:Uncharacterized protein n=1 Tax=Golovinomyces cichoracearum TaxID=62708 RepID=A0A420HHH9_9PEZI|nr:hypothetical protein GcM3_192054 [Golovinomyces cichoracearum]
MTTVPKSNYIINLDLYGKDIDINNEELLTKPIINGYIIWVMKIWQNSEYRDEALIEAFQEDFAEWTTQVFDIADRLLLQDLRDYLRHYSFFIDSKAGVRYDEQLEKFLTQEIKHNWTEQEIEHVTKRGAFNSRFNIKNEYSSQSPEKNTEKQDEQLPVMPDMLTSKVSAKSRFFPGDCSDTLYRLG